MSGLACRGHVTPSLTIRGRACGHPITKFSIPISISTSIVCVFWRARAAVDFLVKRAVWEVVEVLLVRENFGVAGTVDKVGIEVWLICLMDVCLVI